MKPQPFSIYCEKFALGAQRKEVLRAALGRPFRLLAFGSGVGLLLGILASRVLAHIVFQATPRDPLVLTGAVLAIGPARVGSDVDSGATRALD
jgi:predicted lysophospholipase L1 biosynthesis ABC-type transport system permease subunit